jgi:hypothetical protein
MEKIAVQGQLRQKVSETPTLTNKQSKVTWEVEVGGSQTTAILGKSETLSEK